MLDKFFENMRNQHIARLLGDQPSIEEPKQERMYSKEEVIAIVEKSRETGLTAEYLLLTEQFKKK